MGPQCPQREVVDVSHEPFNPTLDDAREIATGLLGEPVDSVSHPEETRFGDASHRFRVRAGGEDLLLKINKRPGQPVGAWYHGKLVEAGIPVPGMPAWSPDAAPGGRACALYEWVEGMPVDFRPEDPPPYDVAQMGAIVRAIHDITHRDGYGHLDDYGSGECATWAEGLLSTWNIGPCLQRGAIHHGMATRLRRLPHLFADELDAARTGLLHYEDIMFSGQVMVDDAGSIVAVVDFAGAMAGDPMWELAVFDYYFGEFGYYQTTDRSFDLGRFREAYAIQYDRQAPLQKLYVIGMLLEKLGFVALDSPRGVHHRQMLAELLAELED